MIRILRRIVGIIGVGFSEMHMGMHFNEVIKTVFEDTYSVERILSDF